MDFDSDFIIQNFYNKIIELLICFGKFNFNISELFSLFRFVYNEFSIFLYRKNKLQQIDDEIYMIYDGDMKKFEERFSNKKLNKKKQDTIFCWDYKNNVKIETSLCMLDLLKFYSKTYKIKNAKKLALSYNLKDCYVVLTDLSKSTHLWNNDRFKMAKSIVEHDRFAYKLMMKNNGIELRNEGDSFLAVFFSKDECMDFVHEFYKNVSNISYDDKNKLGIKIAVNYNKLKRNINISNDYNNIVGETYKMISHSSTDKICISKSIIDSNDKNLYCIH